VQPGVVGQADVGRGAVHQEHVLEGGGLVQRAGDALEPLAVGHQHLGTGVLQAVLDLVGGPPPVEAHQHGALGDRGPEGEAPLGVVLRQHRHPVALGQAEAIAQGVGHAVGRLHEGAEPVGAVAVDDERLVVAAQQSHLGDRPQRGHAVGVHLGGAPEHVLGDDLEHPSRTCELGAHLGVRRHGRTVAGRILDN
jgi:hypothetical protein